MAKNSSVGTPADSVKIRQDRLKAALKANLARRKSQSRARAVDVPDATAGPAAAVPGPSGAPRAPFSEDR